MTRLLRALFLPVSLLLIVSAAYTVPLPLFVERPGTLVSLGEHVEVAGGEPLNGDFRLTLVNYERGTVYGLARSLLEDEAGYIPVEQVTRGVPDDAYFEHQRAVFASAANIAAAFGLQAAGLDVDLDAEGDGALVVGVVAGSPADGHLEAGDVVTGVDGQTVSSADDLVDAVREAGESPLELQVRRDGAERDVRLRPGAVPELDVPGLGAQLQTLPPTVDLPRDVDVDAGEIGGPSAGLMIALTVYDKADPAVDLAQGRTVAGTGTLDPDGTVGPIGGVGQKVLASAAEGIDLFLAPAAQRDEARAALPDEAPMEVAPVATFEEALAVLSDDDVPV